MIIDSINNQKIKYLNKLKDKKYREEEDKFIVEGYHLLEEAYKKGILITLFKEENDSFSLDVETYEISSNIFSKLTDLNNSHQAIGICKKMHNEIIGDRLLLLDNVQDPGNLGTIIRSSKAFNVDTIVLSNDTVDIYNLKVLRATGGNIFHINFVYRDLKETILELKKSGFKVYATDVKEGLDVTLVKHKKIAVIVGNEGNGVKPEIKNICDDSIHIKTNSDVESLNVAMATTIILYELDKE
jgi:TrmH family RNA methyltransferase